jgi:hypothetical protein
MKLIFTSRTNALLTARGLTGKGLKERNVLTDTHTRTPTWIMD